MPRDTWREDYFIDRLLILLPDISRDNLAEKRGGGGRVRAKIIITRGRAKVRLRARKLNRAR